MLANCNLLSSSIGRSIALLLLALLLLAPLLLVRLLNGAAPRDGNPEIEAVLKQDIRKNPGDFRANNKLGELYSRRGNYPAAATYLGAAFRLNPSDYSNAFDLAQAELQAGDAFSARGIVQKLLAREDRPELHNLLGDCEEANGNFREAANQYQIAAHADPSEPNLFSFGSELLKHGAYREAGQVLSYAAERYPQSARICVALGIAQYSVGDYRTAVETFCRAVDLNPIDTRAFEFLGKMIGVAPNLSSEVSARLKRFAAAHPKNAAANYYYAMSLLADPDNKTVDSENSPRHLLERAVTESPSFAEAHYQLGIVCEQEGDTRRAISELESAVRLKPDLTGAHYRLARLYRKTGRIALARREYEALKNAHQR